MHLLPAILLVAAGSIPGDPVVPAAPPAPARTTSAHTGTRRAPLLLDDRQAAPPRRDAVATPDPSAKRAAEASAAGARAEADRASPEGGPGGTASVAGLMALLLGAAGLFLWQRRRQMAAAPGLDLQVLSSVALGARHRVFLLREGERHLLVGTSPGGIVLLDKTAAPRQVLGGFDPALIEHFAGEVDDDEADPIFFGDEEEAAA